MLLARHHVGRAHRPAHRGRLAADAGPVAPLYRPLQPTALCIGKGARDFALLVLRVVAPVRRHRPRLRDVVRIQHSSRIKRLLHTLEPPIGLLPHHPRDVGAPHPAVAMLTRQRPAILPHQVCHIARNRLRALHIPRLLEVQLRPQMQLSHRGVGVVDTVHLVPRHQLGKLRDVGRQIRHRHRRVLHQRLRLPVARAPHQHAEPRLPELPDAANARGRDHRVGVP